MTETWQVLFEKSIRINLDSEHSGDELSAILKGVSVDSTIDVYSRRTCSKQQIRSSKFNNYLTSLRKLRSSEIITVNNE